MDILTGRRYRENRLAAVTCGEPIQRGFAATGPTREMKVCVVSLANGVELTVRYQLANKKHPAYEKVGRAVDEHATRFAAYTAWQFAPLLLKDDLVSLTAQDAMSLASTMYPQDSAVRTAIERRIKNDNTGWTKDADALQRYKFENMEIADELLGIPKPANMYEAVGRTLFYSACELAGHEMLVRMVAEFIEHPEYLK